MYHRLCLDQSAITTVRPESVADSIGTSAQHHYQTRGSSQRVLSKLYSGPSNTRGLESRLRCHLLHVRLCGTAVCGCGLAQDVQWVPTELASEMLTSEHFSDIH